jgi:hypothetical protein
MLLEKFRFIISSTYTFLHKKYVHFFKYIDIVNLDAMFLSVTLFSIRLIVNSSDSTAKWDWKDRVDVYLKFHWFTKSLVVHSNSDGKERVGSNTWNVSHTLPQHRLPGAGRYSFKYRGVVRRSKTKGSMNWEWW